jgi:hypothetical protein
MRNNGFFIGRLCFRVIQIYLMDKLHVRPHPSAPKPKNTKTFAIPSLVRNNGLFNIVFYVFRVGKTDSEVKLHVRPTPVP